MILSAVRGMVKTIHESNQRLLYLALCWQSHNYISTGPFILAIDMWFVHQRKCIVCYFICIQLMMLNPNLRTLQFYCQGHCSNGVVGLVYRQAQSDLKAILCPKPELRGVLWSFRSQRAYNLIITLIKSSQYLFYIPKFKGTIWVSSTNWVCHVWCTF